MEPYDEPHTGFWRPITIAAGVALLIVLLLLGFVFLGNSGKSLRAASQPAPASTSANNGTATPTTTATTTSSGCSLPPGNQTIPELTPQRIRWSIYETVALPVSKTAGPQKLNGDIARCYAHDPLGALIAATQLSARLVLSPSTDVAAQQVVPGPGQSAFIAQDKQAIKTQGSAVPGNYAQFAGFKYVTYTPALAVIEMATQGSNGAYQATTVTVSWVDGDWKLVLQPNGATSPNTLPLSSINGYSTWAGV